MLPSVGEDNKFRGVMGYYRERQKPVPQHTKILNTRHRLSWNIFLNLHIAANWSSALSPKLLVNHEVSHEEHQNLTD